MVFEVTNGPSNTLRPIGADDRAQIGLKPSVSTGRRGALPVLVVWHGNHQPQAMVQVICFSFREKNHSDERNYQSRRGRLYWELAVFGDPLLQWRSQV